MREFYRLRSYLQAGYDVAVGSRDLPESNLVVPQPWHHRMMGAAMRFLVRRLVVGGINDTQCGFKLFKAHAARPIFSQQTLNGFSFDVELLFLTNRLGFRVAEVPVEWHDQPGSKVDIFKAPPAMVRDLFLIRLRHRRVVALPNAGSEPVRW